MTYPASHAPIATAPRQRWSDWANVVLAAWLFISPWILSFGSAAAWNAWIGGAISFFVGLSALQRGARWREGLNLILGAWFFIAPWVLGFTSYAASWDHWAVGALIFLCSAYSLYIGGRQAPPAV